MGRGTTEHPLKPKNARQWYQDAWYRGPDRPRLRLEYNNDREAYFGSYRHSLETLAYLDDRIFTEGMKLFARWESKLPRKSRRAPYKQNGHAALEDLLSALATGGRPSRDYVFVAIDFEGDDDRWGIKELGIASFESNRIFGDTQETLDIDTQAYALGKGRRPKFMFGNTFKLTTEMMPQVIREVFDSYQDKSSGGVVLVGHGVDSDLKIMEDHDIMLESLPAAVGMVDTGQLRPRRLVDALQVHNIPCRQYSLHCAGNDAHYSLRLMLAVMLETIGERTAQGGRAGAIRELIERPLPIPPAHLRVRDYDDDWQQHIDGEDLCMDFILGITDGGA